ncbi:polysaccharide pyruvyl transferase family protein [Litchfieldia alkalitelluris]|uniref:polysaccharide pyruvyl transferase family protein n=1 Tax=Litchfieldia alkalitelluris TaxID=304268 RepID=UPI0014738293|nr:polysaccharide pyruvyl transferase family protein [Litchfieldia alkalitelluris]
MKVGTITFHWATNYGAVLQAFALQQYIISLGYQTEIINYIPFKVKATGILANIKNIRINELIKEKRINKFRKNNLALSTKTFYSNKELVEKCTDYNVLICGSDQVWNEWFLLHSENDVNKSYYLNFAKDKDVRISYATSFGTNELKSEVSEIIAPELKKFKNIGVRENTGKDIVGKLGLQATRVVDPTLLVDKSIYENLLINKKNKKTVQLFSYILHENQNLAHQIKDYLYNDKLNGFRDNLYNNEPIELIDWLYKIKNAKFVVTNSFHGVVFSIIFHKPFIIVPVEGSKMNDRILTLLDALDLMNRKIDIYDEGLISNLYNEKIYWDMVDEKLKTLQETSREFLDNALLNKG